MRILFVDDDQLVAQSAQMALRDLGHDCDVAGRGSTAVALSKRKKYDILVVDADLPDLDGQQVLKEIKKDGVKTPVLLHSEVDDPERPLEFEDAGAGGFIAKPFSMLDLVAKMESVMGGSLKAAGQANPRDVPPPPKPARRRRPLLKARSEPSLETLKTLDPQEAAVKEPVPEPESPVQEAAAEPEPSQTTKDQAEPVEAPAPNVDEIIIEPELIGSPASTRAESAEPEPEPSFATPVEPSHPEKAVLPEPEPEEPEAEPSFATSFEPLQPEQGAALPEPEPEEVSSAELPSLKEPLPPPVARPQPTQFALPTPEPATPAEDSSPAPTQTAPDRPSGARRTFGMPRPGDDESEPSRLLVERVADCLEAEESQQATEVEEETAAEDAWSGWSDKEFASPEQDAAAPDPEEAAPVAVEAAVEVEPAEPEPAPEVEQMPVAEISAVVLEEDQSAVPPEHAPVSKAAEQPERREGNPDDEHIEPAVIADAGNNIPCAILNRWESGAMLLLSEEGLMVPESFTLRPMSSAEQRCLLRWQDADKIGVEFT